MPLSTTIPISVRPIKRGHQAGSHHHRESGIRQHCTRLARGFLLYVGPAGGRQDIQRQSKVLLPQLPLHSRRGAGFIAHRHDFKGIFHPPLEAVSTIGAGDNFNAGIIFGLLKHNVRYEDLDTMDEATWDQVIQYGIEFAAEVCKSFNNSVSKEFAEARKYQP